MRLRNTASDPIVSGGFGLIRGRLSLLGKRFTFTSGNVGFTGGLIPELDLLATSQAGTATISIAVTGPANEPKFEFSSSEGGTEEEALAQLLFGGVRSTGLSALQIAQAADALAQLTGLQSDSFFTRLRRNVGIDDLDVTTDSDGNAKVSAGKYVGEKTYMEVEGSSNQGKASINLDVGKGLTLSGEVDSDGNSAAGIFFEKEY